MALITVNGVALPTPSEMSIGKMDITKAERNVNGLMIIEKVASKTKLEFNWSFLTADQVSSMLTIVSPVFFNVNYPDPQTNSIKTGSFYVGDRTMGMLDYFNGEARYKGFAMNFIER